MAEEIETILYKKRPRKKRRISKITGEVLHTRSWWEGKYWEAYSEYIRARDGFRCVMKDIPGHVCAGVLQAGHIIPRGKRAIKYDERQVFAQCSGGNKAHHHWPQEYTNWFIQKFGQQVYDELVILSRQDAKVPSIKECQERIAYYQAKTARLLHVKAGKADQT